jgi:hypothetical protein
MGAKVARFCAASDKRSGRGAGRVRPQEPEAATRAPRKLAWSVSIWRMPPRAARRTVASSSGWPARVDDRATRSTRPSKVSGVVPRPSTWSDAVRLPAGSPRPPGSSAGFTPATCPVTKYDGTSPGRNHPSRSSTPTGPRRSTSKRYGWRPPPRSEMGPVSGELKSPGRPSTVPRRKSATRPATSNCIPSPGLRTRPPRSKVPPWCARSTSKPKSCALPRAEKVPLSGPCTGLEAASSTPERNASTRPSTSKRRTSPGSTVPRAARRPAAPWKSRSKAARSAVPDTRKGPLSVADWKGSCGNSSVSVASASGAARPVTS